MNIIICNDCHTRSTDTTWLNPPDYCPNCFSNNVTPDYDMREEDICLQEGCE